MARKTLCNKVWDAHVVTTLPTGQTQMFIALHLVNDITSPQAFGMLKEHGLKVAFPERTFAVADHVVPTTRRQRPFADPQADAMFQALADNTRRHGVTLFDFSGGWHGIEHVIGPELGLMQPGMTIACGDSHTSTHGALGALAFGIGSSQVRDVLASQCLAMDPLKVRRIEIDGQLGPAVTAKDVALYLINRLGVKAGLGFAYEYSGRVIEDMHMEARMTLCNMSIEGGARVGYVNPDEKTFAYLRGRPYAPQESDWPSAVERWRSFASEPDAEYDDIVRFDAGDIEPMVTWGITPAQSVRIGEHLPDPALAADDHERQALLKAYGHMKFQPGSPMRGTPIHVAFIGSCTNGRITDLRSAASVLRGRKVAANVRALVAPGSMQVRKQAMEEGLDSVFREAGFEWREAGCSMCIGMNPDKLRGDEIAASSSNRNFIGRQGSPVGRTLLMSPAMVAAAAVKGCVVDVREFDK